MLGSKRRSTEELAAELLRRETALPVDRLGVIARRKRSRLSRELGRSDLAAVLRAYYGTKSAQHG